MTLFSKSRYKIRIIIYRKGISTAPFFRLCHKIRIIGRCLSIIYTIQASLCTISTFLDTFYHELVIKNWDRIFDLSCNRFFCTQVKTSDELTDTFLFIIYSTFYYVRGHFFRLQRALVGHQSVVSGHTRAACSWNCLMYYSILV